MALDWPPLDLSFESLWELFAHREDVDVLETELLNRFFPEARQDGLSLDLFQKHFVLYRRLWIFDDELRLRTGHRLWIRGIRATLKRPPSGCRAFDTDQGTWCGAPAAPSHFCERHAGPGLETSTLKAYYLDDNNFEGMTHDRLQVLVGNFWHWWRGQGPLADARAVLGLSGDEPWPEVLARWRQLSHQHHPDHGGDQAFFQKLSAAWTVVKESRPRAWE